MMERSILHCDLNNFFASVECHDHPEFNDRPIAVCGSVEDRHGIVLAKNERAKSFGVKTAEPVWQAKNKCADLLIVPPHFDRYEYFSKTVSQIYLDYTNQVEAFGIDECWLDVTGSKRLFGSDMEIAGQIRERVKSEQGLTVSVGVSFNKIFAKLASDMKKPDAITQITAENYKQKVWPQPVGTLLGVGGATAKRLHAMGIHTIADLAQTDLACLTATFGKAGQFLWTGANGLDTSEVMQNETGLPPKSIGNSITCAQDLYEMGEVWPVLLYLSEKISNRMRMCGLLASGVQLMVKDNRLHTYQHQCRLSSPTRLTMELADSAKKMFAQGYKWQCPVRALGISGFALVPETAAQQASFFHNIIMDEKVELLESRVEELRGKYGNSAVKRAVFMENQPFFGSTSGKK